MGIMPKIDVNIRYGMIIVNETNVDEIGLPSVIEFLGMEETPTEDDLWDFMSDFMDENPDIDWDVNDYVAMMATPEIVKFYRDKYIGWIISQN